MESTASFFRYLHHIIRGDLCKIERGGARKHLGVVTFFLIFFWGIFVFFGMPVFTPRYPRNYLLRVYILG